MLTGALHLLSEWGFALTQLIIVMFGIGAANVQVPCATPCNVLKRAVILEAMEGVKKLLTEICLDKYADKFEEKEFYTIDQIMTLDQAGLDKMVLAVGLKSGSADWLHRKNLSHTSSPENAGMSRDKDNPPAKGVPTSSHVIKRKNIVDVVANCRKCLSDSVKRQTQYMGDKKDDDNDYAYDPADYATVKDLLNQGLFVEYEDGCISNSLLFFCRNATGGFPFRNEE